MQSKLTEHESFGMLEIHQTNSNKGISLFGSSIRPTSTIRLRILGASVDRHLNRDWYRSEGVITEVEMSYNQFAEAITSMNTQGVPVTLRYANGQKLEACPFESQREKFQDEFAQAIDEVLGKAREAASMAKKMLQATGTLKRAERDQIANLIYSVQQSCEDNLAYIARQFNEQMDHTVLEAKGEIEGFFSQKIHSLGSAALTEQLEDGLIVAPKIQEDSEQI